MHSALRPVRESAPAMTTEYLDAAAGGVVSRLVDTFATTARDLARAYTEVCLRLRDGENPLGLLDVIRHLDNGAAHLGVAPAAFDDEDLCRLVFEMLMFGAYIAMFQEAEKHLRRRRLLSVEPDAERIRAFNTLLLHRIELLCRDEMGGVREVSSPPPDFIRRSGEPVAACARRRIEAYYNAGAKGGTLEAFEHFCMHVADGVGPHTYWIMKVVVAKYLAEPVVRAAQDAVGNVFK